MKTKHLISAVCGAVIKVAFAITVVVVIYRGAILAYDYGYRVFTEPPIATGEGRTISVTVTEHMSPTEIGELFASKGLVRDARLFSIQYLLSEYREDVVPGEYEFNTAMTVEEMLAVMAQPVEERTTEKDGSSTPGSGSDNEGTSTVEGNDIEDESDSPSEE